MSLLRDTVFVRRIVQKLAREVNFRLAVVLLFTGAPAIFAGTNTPVEAFPNQDPFSVMPASTSHSPLAPTTDISTGAVPAKASFVTPTNGTASVQTNSPAPLDLFVRKLETARYLLRTRQTQDVKPLLVSLLAKNVPESIQKSALLELAALAQDAGNLSRAQDIYAQFLDRWPDASRVPEVLLEQGRLFREMGLHDLALTKFYAVMTTALTLKNDRLKYYEHLVVQAQMEIAETHFSLGKYAAAAEFYSRLLKQNNPEIDKPQILYKLVRCYSSTTNYDKAIACGREFLARYPNAPQEPGVRFYLAAAFKALGRDNESLQQVLTLLQEQSAQAAKDPEAWAYWRQRAGNLIANQFYREGDYPHALEIYTSLAQLDPSPKWQLPVWYQIGMTYEHLMQPQKAIKIYNRILSRRAKLGTNAPPNLSSIADMARWRVGFIHWQNHAQSVNREFAETNAALTANVTASAAPPAANHE